MSDVLGDGLSQPDAFEQAASGFTQSLLPQLRDDLQIQAAPPAEGGVRQWCLFDPMRGAYFQINDLAVRLLANWRMREPAKIADAASTDLQPASVNDVETIYRFLLANELTDGASPDQRAAYERRKAASRKHPLTWLIHSYLFFRIPLFRPDRLLTKMLPLVRPLFSATTIAVCMLFGLAGIYLLGRQWDEFTRTLSGFLTLEGAIGLTLALGVTKSLHELGHALMAKRFGCRVHSMGVAFLVMLPMLYTDVTDTWRLTRWRQRLLVGGGGMLVELCLACLATFLWSFLPDGVLRNAAFAVATVTWVTTLAINSNPFMRFDGYFLLADWFRVENLQGRAFAYCRWALRETLFGFGVPAPEPVSNTRRRVFYIWGYCTWVWRVILFTTIALIIYHLFPKAIGLPLATVEIGWFILRPIVLEVREIWRMKSRMTLNRQTITTVVALFLLALILLIPWRSQIPVPVVQEAEHQVLLFTPGTAQLAGISPQTEQRVLTGKTLFLLKSPDLELQLQQAERRAAVMRHQLKLASISDLTIELQETLLQQLRGQIAEIYGLRKASEKLAIAAPIDGVLRDLPRGLQAGRWLQAGSVLGRVIDPRTSRFVGYVEETALARIDVGARARFMSDDGLAESIDAVVVSVERSAAQTIEALPLVTLHGGPIAARADAAGRMVADIAHYRVILHPVDPLPAPRRARLGTAVVQGPSRALAADLWRSTVAVLIRESGF